MATDQTKGLRINPSPEWRWGLGWDSVQQLAPRPALAKAWQSRMKTVWKPTNPPTHQRISEVGRWGSVSDVNLTIDSLPELPGYILFGGGNLGYQLLTPLADDRGGPSIKVPVNHGSDLNEISFAMVNGAEVLTTWSLTCTRA